MQFLRKAILFLLAALLLFSTATAAETDVQNPELGEDDVSGYILQTGGLLRSAGTKGTGLRVDPYSSAKAVIYEGLNARETEIGLREFGIPVSDIGSLFAEVVNAHGELFFVTGDFQYGVSGDTVVYIVPTYQTVTDAQIAEFDAAVYAVLSGIESTWTDFQKALYLHDYLVTHCEYDLTLSNYSAYDALVTESAVCQGYSLAYGYLCTQLGIPNQLVTSEGIDHAWNLITLGDEQFYIDCTWDDPSNQWYEAYCAHTYFLCSRDSFGHTGKNGDVFDWVSGRTEVYDSILGSDTYDSAWFRNVITAIPVIGDLCAYAKWDDHDNVWLRALSTGEEQAVSLPAASRWPVWNQENRVWTTNYTSFTKLNGLYYFTTPTQVYSLSTNGTTEQVYTLTQTEQTSGFLYGLVSDSGTLYYNIGTVSYETSFIRSPLVIGATEPDPGDWTYSVSDGSAMITAYNGTDADVTVPSTIDGIPVVTVAGYAFYDNQTIRRLTFSEGIRTLKSVAVYNCPNLAEIVLPSTVVLAFEETANDAFYREVIEGSPWLLNCDGLTSISVAGDSDNIKSIDGVLFSKDGTKLLCYPASKRGIAYTVPSGVGYISQMAFAYNPYLEAVQLPDSVTHIGYWAFNWCRNLTQINIPEGCSHIGQYAFQATGLTEFYIPASMSVLVGGAFCQTALSSITVSQDNSIFRVENGALYSYSDILESDSLVYYLANQQAQAFTVPESVTAVEMYAFQFAANLETLTLYGGLQTIGGNAFTGCTSLTKTVYLGSAEQWKRLDIERDNDVIIRTLDLTFPVDGDWLAFHWQLSAEVLTITGTGALGTVGVNYHPDYPWADYASKVEKIIISEGITSIGDDCFWDFPCVTEVQLPNGLTVIGNGAFYNCVSLATVTFQAGVTRIGDNAFGRCFNLRSLVLPEGLISIGEQAFSAAGLREITIPSTVSSIGRYAFDCQALAMVYFKGTRAEWNDISIGVYNFSLLNARIRCLGDPPFTCSFASVTYNGTYVSVVLNLSDCDGVTDVFVAVYQNGRMLGVGAARATETTTSATVTIAVSGLSGSYEVRAFFLDANHFVPVAESLLTTKTA